MSNKPNIYDNTLTIKFVNYEDLKTAELLGKFFFYATGKVVKIGNNKPITYTSVTSLFSDNDENDIGVVLVDVIINEVEPFESSISEHYLMVQPTKLRRYKKVIDYEIVDYGTPQSNQI